MGKNDSNMRASRMLFLSVFHVIISLISAEGKNDGRYYYQNSVYKEEIKSVQMYLDGNELSNPVMELNGNAPLVLKFDDLSAKAKDYSYTIIHCDANWNESILMQNEYLEGFPDNPLNDYAFSINATVAYVNYRLEIPNQETKLKYSGNYVVVVFEDKDKEKLVLVKRFHVLEPLARIEGQVKRATFDPFKGSNHEVDFDVYTGSLRVQNPHEEVKVVVSQNRRWDNAIRNLKPLFIRDRVLSYDYNKENVFPAGNEFRYFDIRTNRFPGENVESIKFHRPYYHATLLIDEMRSNKKFFSYKEMNGNYTVESQDRVQDFDTECDYTFVHFTLPLPVPLVGGSVNVFGALTDWNANKSNQMTWNPQTAAYELTLLLKQGYYNYQYVYVPAGSPVADAVNIEGSFYETENDYQIFVYFKGMGDRYDRLVGFQELNSANR
ncbi:MAG: hypothetical protein A2W90_12265 [Bacteroidetes bacterium GWF2_42_66]|nr:MAG: hypothetical protein A2W89_17250 [Bacteroidetes bacterium GWE2_42_39]OFY40146.1 MAG: hypothetical protein A2W90_12265 [Bacteroidetes bacterium GWF2_42_66]HBL73974.1 DUF5103 domain-containing protein [Prolixibacteraceae bacterium]HCU61607.1 DUF5103 domain-containing protein [Prolixibacteraceae bacterium]